MEKSGGKKKKIENPNNFIVNLYKKNKIYVIY